MTRVASEVVVTSQPSAAGPLSPLHLYCLPWDLGAYVHSASNHCITPIATASCTLLKNLNPLLRAGTDGIAYAQSAAAGARHSGGLRLQRPVRTVYQISLTNW